MFSLVNVNRIAYVALIVLSSAALLLVFVGMTRPPLPDEGALAHLFQLAVVLTVPAFVVFLSTAEWERPLRAGARFAVPVLLLALAFATLFYMEQYYYPQHYPIPHR
jgi:uncharacterized YccA/Bax inhibitor family protein